MALLGTHEDVLSGAARTWMTSVNSSRRGRRPLAASMVVPTRRAMRCSHERELELAEPMLDVLRSVSSHARAGVGAGGLGELAVLETSLQMLVEDLRYLNEDMVLAQEVLGQMEGQLAGMRPPDLPDRATPQEIAALVQDIAELHSRYQGYRVGGRLARVTASMVCRMCTACPRPTAGGGGIFDIERSEVGRVRDRFESEA